jgi:hypothetical protein
MANTDEPLSFRQRFSLHSIAPIDDDVPKPTRVALAYLYEELMHRGYLPRTYQVIERAVLSAGRLEISDLKLPDKSANVVSAAISKMEWCCIYDLLETTYHRLLIPVMEPDFPDDRESPEHESVSLKDVRTYFSIEVNHILSQDNLAFVLIDGYFQKPGRAATQQNLDKAGKVLGDPRLVKAREHFTKARKFFDQRPEPDTANTVKEAMIAIEATLESLTGESVQNFSTAVKKIQGNDKRQIPGSLAASLNSLYGYRGNAKGAAHAALNGSKLDEPEAELVLSLTAAYITYLFDLLAEPEVIPF